MQTIKIDTESKYESDKPRTAKRIVAEVEVEPSNGVTFHGHRLKQGPNRFEMYVDRVPELEKLVRTEAHTKALEQAQTLADQLSEDWLNEHARKASPEKREELRKTQCPHNKWTALALLGLKTGVPPITSLRFVGLSGKVYETFGDVPEDEILDPIPTPETLASASRDQLTEFARLISDALKEKDTGKSNGKR